MRFHRSIRTVLCCTAACVLPSAAPAQAPPKQVFYVAKPLQPAPYDAPMKPFVRLADLKAKHKGQANWSELVVKDENNHAEVISAAPGTKVPRHLHSDAPEYWFVQEGRIRFEIEDPPGKFQVQEAGKGTLVFCPERHIHSLEVIGSEPAIRLEVKLADTTDVYVSKPEHIASGYEYASVTLSTGNNPDDVPNEGGKPDRLFFNIPEMQKQHDAQKGWSDLAIKKNRAHANIICGHKATSPHDPHDRGHYHTDFAEIWVIMLGEQRYTIEGQDPFVAGEGDVVYAPATRWHMIEPWGDGPSCRLAMTPYPAGNHFYDPPRR